MTDANHTCASSLYLKFHFWADKPDTAEVTFPPYRSIKALVSSRPIDSPTPVKTNVKPSKQLSAPFGISFDPGFRGPASSFAYLVSKRYL